MSTEKQSTNRILMVRPANFGYNEETAESNAFQTKESDRSTKDVKVAAIREFDELVRRLRETGIEIFVWQDAPQPLKTDAVFPNNWITFHADGTIITYPMLSENRRAERDEKLIEYLMNSFNIVRRLRFEDGESENRFLEGTGSMILDRANRLAYACHSPRTDPVLIEKFCKQMVYQSVLFKAADRQGIEIYHTNVMMALGETFVVICMESVSDPGDQSLLIESFRRTGKEIIEISFAQMEAFAGNMLQVRNDGGERILVMSEQAYRSLRKVQIKRLEKHTRLLYSPLYTIETYGGGSARCMMAEIFLPDL